jgi:nitronate monooxygenase
MSGIEADLVLPVIVAPMFLVSGPELVIASCKAGLMGSMPTQNARTIGDLEAWLDQITSALAAERAAGRKPGPWALSLNVHPTYERLDEELALIARFKPDVVITVLGSPARIMSVVHGYGGKVYADVNALRQARHAAEARADGIVLVCSGAGGHTGSLSAFAFVAEVRKFFTGTIVLAGGVADGRTLRAAQLLGADLVYMGTRFLAARETMSGDHYRELVVRANIDGVVATRVVTGVLANWLRESLLEAGFREEDFGAVGKVDFSDVMNPAKPWKNIHGAGQCVGAVDRVASVAEITAELVASYREIIAGELGDAWARRYAAPPQGEVPCS